jgi:hypothetical protein
MKISNSEKGVESEKKVKGPTDEHASPRRQSRHLKRQALNLMKVDDRIEKIVCASEGVLF